MKLTKLIFLSILSTLILTACGKKNYSESLEGRWINTEGCKNTICEITLTIDKSNNNDYTFNSISNLLGENLENSGKVSVVEEENGEYIFRGNNAPYFKVISNEKISSNSHTIFVRND